MVNIKVLSMHCPPINYTVYLNVNRHNEWPPGQQKPRINPKPLAALSKKSIRSCG